MESVSLEQIIRQYVQLDPPTAKGWSPVLCRVCGDRGHKGKRAGFRFEGDVVGYHCFNCGHSTSYDPSEHEKMPKKMERVLHDFGIPESDWQQVLFSSLTLRRSGKNKDKKVSSIQIEPLELPLPETFYPLKDAGSHDKWATIARYYLEEDRGIDPNSYPFLLSSKTEIPHLKKWFGRVIIPIYKGNKLIYYVGRDLTSNKMKKYENPAVSREKVFYGYDRLFEDVTTPLYITEGWFDGFAIDGVAILGNEISKTHTIWLNKSPRKKVYIPDRFGDGKRAAEHALSLGWHISTPDIGGCKDMDEAVRRYGKLYVMKTLIENTSIGFEAQAKLGVYCIEKKG